MHLLITGGTGFIGRHVAEAAVRRGHRVRFVGRRPAVVEGAQYVERDLRDTSGLVALLDGVDAVVHCAASLTGGATAQEADTVGITRSLVAALDQSSVTHVVHLSTLALYDFTGIPAWSDLTEESPLDDAEDRHPYVMAKRSQETLIAEAAAGRRHWAILRPGLVYGPGRTWFHHLGSPLGSRLWLSVAPESPLPLCHVDHVADAALLALERATPLGMRVNLVDEDPPARGEYLRALARRAPVRPAIVGLPWPALAAVSSAAEAVNRALGGRIPLPGLLASAGLAARCKPFRYPTAAARDLLGWMSRRQWAHALDEALTPRTT